MASGDGSAGAERAALEARLSELERELAARGGVAAPADHAARHLRTVLDNLGGLAVELDRDARIVYANQPLLLLTGRPIADVLGADWLEAFVPSSEHRDVRRVFSDLLAAGVPVEYENHLVTRSGDERMVRWRNTILRDAAGTPDRIVSIGQDVTERSLMFDHLRASEERYRAIVETAVDGIITMDEASRITSFNPAAVRLFGYAAVEAVGQDITLLMPAPYRDEHASYVARYLETGQASIIGRRPREVLGRRKDGTAFPLELAVSELQQGGRRTFTGIVRDLSELRRAQVLAEMGTLASALAHEIGTPMNVILGRAEQLRAQTEERGTAAALDAIIRQVERIVRLINQLLAFTRRSPLSQRSTDVNQVIESTLDVLRERMSSSGVELECVLEPALHRIHADPDQLGQVVLNLIVNALDALEPAGRLRLVSRNLEGTGDERHVELTVTDSGCGMPPDVRERAFEPFFTTKAPGKGTGLGLPVVQRIVREHRGEIFLTSSPGSGTTFRVVLPATRPKPASPNGSQGTP